ncbi:MAG: ribulokinase [Chitinophagaceae bacterium]|nr:MAG: ribulokinase [Chitinophagaceae bacterium]
MPENFVIGVDYGTDSVRTIILNASNGAMVASSIFQYPRWRDGLFCDPAANQFRQHPLDYIEGLEASIGECLKAAGETVRKNITAISIDTTGSTPVAVTREGQPLALLPAFENNPDAMFVLWKDHTATLEASRINNHAKNYKTNYLRYVGGVYSSEWFWAKLLYVLKHDEGVRNACYSWVEHCDWIPFLLCGGNDVHKMKRSVCAAGHKALWAPEFDGLPPEDFFDSLDPLLKGFRCRLYQETYTADQAAGNLSEEWAQRLGLSTRVLIGIGAFDAHMGAVGAQILPYHLSKVMGTSTCDMLVAPVNEIGNKLVKGICGQVKGSIIPGMTGLEAGQSAFGDTYAWFRGLLSWPLQSMLQNSRVIDKTTAIALKEEISVGMIRHLSELAGNLEVRDDTELALDWFNGRRTPNANQELKAAITGLTLASDAPRLFYALAEGTCFGAKKIVDCFVDQGVPVRGLIGLGGVAKKSAFIMQMLANVMNMPIRIHRSEQACASGAAMFAATVSGHYQKVEDAMLAMGSGFEAEYKPQPAKTTILQNRYKKFNTLSRVMEENFSATINMETVNK